MIQYISAAKEAEGFPPLETSIYDTKTGKTPKHKGGRDKWRKNVMS